MEILFSLIESITYSHFGILLRNLTIRMENRFIWMPKISQRNSPYSLKTAKEENKTKTDGLVWVTFIRSQLDRTWSRFDIFLLFFVVVRNEILLVYSVLTSNFHYVMSVSRILSTHGWRTLWYHTPIVNIRCKWIKGELLDINNPTHCNSYPFKRNTMKSSWDRLTYWCDETK